MGGKIGIVEGELKEPEKPRKTYLCDIIMVLLPKKVKIHFIQSFFFTPTQSTGFKSLLCLFPSRAAPISLPESQ